MVCFLKENTKQSTVNQLGTMVQQNVSLNTMFNIMPNFTNSSRRPSTSSLMGGQHDIVVGLQNTMMGPQNIMSNSSNNSRRPSAASLMGMTQPQSAMTLSNSGSPRSHMNTVVVDNPLMAPIDFSKPTDLNARPEKRKSTMENTINMIS